MLRDLVWFDGGRAANEDTPSERIQGDVVYLVQPEDVLVERPLGVPPPPPQEAFEEGGGHG